MTDKLKPCPHCEQIPKRHIFEDGSGFITCKCDKLTGGTTIFANWRRPDGKITKRRKEVSAFSEHEADIIWNSRPIEDALQARIAELVQNLKGFNTNAYVCKCGHAWLDVNELAAQSCPHCGEVIVFSVGELVTENEELEAKNKELTQALADLDKWICIAEQLDFLLDEYGRSTEPMTPKAEEVRDWMQVHVINPQERIAELEQELKNQVELHNEWLGTYRIKLDYIEELERKIKRLTT